MRHELKMLALVAGFFLSAIAQADPPEGRGGPILDQFNVGPADSSINGGSSVYQWQQGVTVGISGQLTRIDISVYLDLGDENVPTEVSVSLGPPWQSSNPVWTVTEVLVEGWNTFRLNQEKISMEAGDEFVIGIQGSSSTNFNPGIQISYGDLYPGGDLYLNGSLNSDVNDILFRTYVKQSKGKPN